MKNLVRAVLSACAVLSASAEPVIDDTPTRVQTSLRVDMRQVGTLKPKAVGEISASRWTVDCAGMDREHVDWRSIREYVAPLGIARMRQQAGWARCEKDPGKYEFAWLDQSVYDAKRRGISTWLELSYGNPAYPGGGGRQLSAGFPSSEEGLAAWDRWVEKIVTHYKGTIRDFCIWNEPENNRGNKADFAAAFAIRTAEIIKRIEPDASIAAFALASAKRAFVEPFVLELKRRGKAHLFTAIAYHHYRHNPDTGYEKVEECRKVIAEHAPNLKLWQGEGGTWSEWGASGALSRHHWTELTQAKYDLRRSLGDLGHGDDTEVFHICDMEYRTSGFHDGLVRYGLVKTTGQAEGFRVLKVKTSYYAIQNAVSVFNDALEALDHRSTSTVTGLEHGVAYDWRDRKSGLPVTVFWDAAKIPSDRNETRRVELRIKAKPFASPVWVDLITGDAYEINPTDVRTEGEWTVYAVPGYDSPTFVTDRSVLDLQQSWFVQATGGWRTTLREDLNIRKVAFYGPYPKSTVATSVAELERLGKPQDVEGELQSDGRTFLFDFKRLCTGAWPERGIEPDYVGFAVVTIDAKDGESAVLYEKNDWYWQLFLNGKAVTGRKGGDIGSWTPVSLGLKPGRNEIIFRTEPGSGLKWTTALGIERRRIEPPRDLKRVGWLEPGWDPLGGEAQAHEIGEEVHEVQGRKLLIRKYECKSAPIWAVSIDGARDYERVDLTPYIPQKPAYSWVELRTGLICDLPDFRAVPVCADPVVLVWNALLPLKTDWAKMTPAEIVDALYRPGQGLVRGGNGQPRKMDVSQEPWIKMKTSDFLPCFDKYGQFKYREWPGKTHSDEDLKSVAEAEEKDLAAHPGPRNRDRFGGWSDGPQLKATGRFRTEKVGGKWWLVDPEGRLFWSWGPVRVTPSSAMTPLNGNPRTPRVGGDLPDRDCMFEDLPKAGDPFARFYETYDDLLKPFYLARNETRWFDFSAANLCRKYGEGWFEKYADSCHRRLRSWGCNTIANSSDLRICLMDRTPYAERVECQSRPIEGSHGAWWKFRDPFDPSFTQGVRKALETHGREAHDPWCIGFFIDNEIQWGHKDTDLAQWTLWSPDDQPAKVEFVKRLEAKGIDPKRGNVPAEELRAFTSVIVEEYFKRTREAVKAFDRELLYLGCRFAGATARPWVIGACAKYCDVVSYNIYRDKIDDWRLPDNLDAPVMIGEFHFGAHDRGLFGASLINKGSQAGRAAALKDYVESALANPQMVGVHWHQFSDQATSGRFDGEYFQVGWTDICDRPYKETVEALRSIDIYATRGK